MTEYAARIAAASGDASALLALAIELAQENARLAAEADVLARRRQRDAERKREARASEDVHGQARTGMDSADGSPSPRPSLLPPTPPNNSSLPPNPSKSRPPRGKPAPWLPRFGAAWEQAYGGVMPTDRSVRPLRRMVEAHGEDEAVRRWGNYLRATNAQFASAERFAATWAAWDKAPAHGTIAVVDSARDDKLWNRAVAIVGELSRREMTAEQYQALPQSVRDAFSSIGGWTTVRDAKADTIVFRKREWLTAYHAADDAHRQQVPA